MLFRGNGVYHDPQNCISFQITSEELVTAYIDRVKEVNPLLNALVDERYRAAVEDARAVDRSLAEARRSGKLAELVAGKPLLGVPFTVKESCSLAGESHIYPYT